MCECSLPSLEPLRTAHCAIDRGTERGQHGGRAQPSALDVQIPDALEHRGAGARAGRVCGDDDGPGGAVDVMVQNQRENLEIIADFAANARAKPSSYFAQPEVYIKCYL